MAIATGNRALGQAAFTVLSADVSLPTRGIEVSADGQTAFLRSNFPFDFRFLHTSWTASAGNQSLDARLAPGLELVAIATEAPAATAINRNDPVDRERIYTVSFGGTGPATATLIPQVTGYRAPQATSISGDGNIVAWDSIVPRSNAGDPYRVAFVRNMTTGQTVTIAPPNSIETFVTRLSRDGSTLVGGYSAPDRNGNHGFVWSATNGRTELPLITFDGYNAENIETSSINADGSIAYGFMSNRTANQGRGAARGFAWSSSSGYTLLPVPSTHPQFVTWDYFRPLAASDDGRIVVGTSEGTGEAASLWRADLGTVDLNVFLPTLGINLGDIYLYEANAISADGLTIVGSGYLGGINGTTSVGWVAHIPTPGAAGLLLLGGSWCTRRRRMA